jgi:hypothetical protein
MQTNGYEFSSAPRSVTNKRSKFRENGKPQNIMYDKRVYRGSSYSTREVCFVFLGNTEELRKSLNCQITYRNRLMLHHQPKK